MFSRKPDLGFGLTGEERRELGDLDALAERMTGYVAPDPTAAETARLIAHLRPLVAARTEAAERPLTSALGSGLPYWMQLVRSQVRLLEGHFWWASLLVFALGLFVTLRAGDGTTAGLVFLLSPLGAAAAVAYAFRPGVRSLWEVERACPIRPLELLYVRLAVVLSVNMALTLFLMAGISWQQPQHVLWRLLVIWFGPMLALAGSAMYAAVRWGQIAGVGAPTLLWTTLVLVGQRVSVQGGLSGVRLLDWFWPAVSHSNLFLAVSVLLGIGGLGMILIGGRFAVEGAQWS